MNNIVKVRQLEFIERINLLTELDFACNPIQNKKHYRSQVLYHIPQLRLLDGIEIQIEEKVKAENLHGIDLNDRAQIFKAMLPQETFIDRRIAVYDDIDEESEDEISADETLVGGQELAGLAQASIYTENESVARLYVGELFDRIEAEENNNK